MSSLFLGGGVSLFFKKIGFSFFCAFLLSPLLHSPYSLSLSFPISLSHNYCTCGDSCTLQCVIVFLFKETTDHRVKLGQVFNSSSDDQFSWSEFDQKQPMVCPSVLLVNLLQSLNTVLLSKVISTIIHILGRMACRFCCMEKI